MVMVTALEQPDGIVWPGQQDRLATDFRATTTVGGIGAGAGKPVGPW